MDFSTYRMRKIARSGLLSILGTFSSITPGIHILSSHFTTRSIPDRNIYYDFISYLMKHCELVRIEEAVELVQKRNQPKSALVAFTFDDGFEECHSIVAPVLEEFNTNAAFFINGGFVNGDEVYLKAFTQNVILTPGKTPMSWSQIKDLSNRGHIIGSHTYDHIDMNQDDYQFVEHQILHNKQVIEAETGISSDYFSIPFGQMQHIREETLGLIEQYHKIIFSGTNFKNYHSFDGRVINRRHMESSWPAAHWKYFLSFDKKYE